MAFEMKELSGSLFKNDKQGVETRPDYTGNCLINGQDMWVSAWIKEGTKGKYMSLSFKPKDGSKSEVKRQEVLRQPAQAIDMDDVPF